jgi:hypothetical protein
MIWMPFRAIVPAALLACIACAHSEGARLRPDSSARLGSLHVVALLPPDVKAFEIGAGGRPEEKIEWTEASRNNARRALLAHLNRLGLSVRQVPEDEDLRALSHAVLASIVDFTYLEPFPAKMRRFEYSVGSIDALCDASGADALVLVWGMAYVPTLGRQFVNALVGGPPQQARLMAAVVDRTGSVLWFNMSSAAGDGAWSTFTDEKGAEGIVKAVFSEFPARTARP